MKMKTFESNLEDIGLKKTRVRIRPNGNRLYAYDLNVNIICVGLRSLYKTDKIQVLNNVFPEKQKTFKHITDRIMLEAENSKIKEDNKDRANMRLLVESSQFLYHNDHAQHGSNSRR